MGGTIVAVPATAGHSGTRATFGKAPDCGLGQIAICPYGGLGPKPKQPTT